MSVTDNDDVFVAKIQESLPPLAFAVSKIKCSLCLCIQKPKQIPLDLETLNDRFYHQICIRYRLPSVKKPPRERFRGRQGQDPRVRSGLNVLHDRFREPLDVVGLFLLGDSGEGFGDDFQTISMPR
jgi:hypothetical protein